MSVGRIFYVQPSVREIYYMWLLLNIMKGLTCYEDIRTINGVIYPTFRDACLSLDLLDDEKEYIETIHEAAF